MGLFVIITINRYITERNRVEETLRRTHNYLDKLINHTNAPTIVWDPELRITRFNRAFEHLSGYVADDVLGRELHMLFDEASRDESLDKIAGTFRGEYWESIEVPILRKDGDIRLALWNSANIYAEDGITLLSTIAQGIDITERKQLEQQLQQSQKMEAIGRLAGGIAHDFNNVLTVISGNTELILIDLPEESPHHDRILNIMKAATHAAELTQQLLAFSRKQIANPRVINLNDSIASLMGMLRRVIGEDIKLTFLPGEDVGNICIDPEQLTQVFMNLVVNAREAMPRGGTLAIETEQVEIDEPYVNTHPYISPGRYARLTVSDTGVGMSDEVRDKVFEPYFTTKESGTGLGLSTVFGIVKQNRGSINVYSEEGIGTTFKIYLPITQERAEAAPAEAGEADLPTGSETILLVEDEDTVRDLAVEVLTDLGYEVHNFTRAEEAFLFAEDHKETIDLLLTDVVMPGMDGPELADAVLESCPSVRVLYMSGYTDNAITYHGVLDEGVNLLQKPFTLAEIAKKVREVLDADRSD